MFAATVTRDFVVSLLVIAACVHLFSADTASQAGVNQTPANQTATNQAAPEPSDPAAVLFASDAGMVLHAIKPAAVADYEAVIAALQSALSKAAEADVRKVAASWRVYKAAEPDAKSNVIYVHMLQPAQAGTDYRPSLWLDKLLDGAPPELLAKYREAFAMQPSKLSLTELANMSVAPVAPANTTPPAPVKNASPPSPVDQKPMFAPA